MLKSGRDKVGSNQQKVGEVDKIAQEKKDGEQETIMRITPNQKEATTSEQSEGNDMTGSKCCIVLSKKAKIIIAVVSVVTILLTIGLSVGLTLALKPKVIDVKPSTQFVFGQDKSVMRLTEMIIQDKNLFEPNVKFTIYKSQAVATGGQRLLQQQNNSFTYINTINFEQEGLIARVFPNNSVQIMVDPEQLINYLNSTDDQVARMLQQAEDPNTQEIAGTDTWMDVETELSKALSFEMNQGKDVDFQYSNFVTFQFNTETKIFEQVQDSDKSTKRLLLQRRLLSLKKAFKKVAKVVKKIVKPVIKAVRVAGPIIGIAAGAAIGFAIGGPAGSSAAAFAAAKTGMFAGSIAQSVVKSCVPRKSMRIKCNGKIALQEGLKAGVTWGVGKVTGFNDWYDKWNPFIKK